MPTAHGVTLADYARAVMADLPALLAAMGSELSAAGTVAPGARASSLERADAAALNEILGRPAQAAVWADPLQAALAAAVQAELQPPTLALVKAEAPTHLEPGLLSLSLKDEQEIEEEIELARFIQQLESTAETVLRDLRPLAAALRQQVAVTPEAALLHPQACAAALGRAARQLPLSGRARVACLQRLGDVMVKPMRDAYTRQMRQLKDAGVEPARFRIRLTPDATRAAVAAAPATAPLSTPTSAPAAYSASAADPGGDRIAAVLAQLVSQAQLKLAAQPVPPYSAAPAPATLPRELADVLMQQLIQTLGQEVQAAPSMQRMFRQLGSPAQRLALREPALWQQHRHPWWLLLDRLMALCAVTEDQPGRGQDALAAHCEPILTRFEQAAEPDADLCRQVLDEVNTAVRTLVQATLLQGPDDGVVTMTPAPSAADAAPPAAHQPAAVQGPLHTLLRDQMVRQLRDNQAPSSVRRFLLGPWVRTLANAVQGPAADASRAERYSEWVDELFAAISPDPKAESNLPALLEVAREGLQSIGLDEAQIDAWLFDLTLRVSDARTDENTARAGRARLRHDNLPTVPIELQRDSLQSARARRDREAWLYSLTVGDICRLFLDARWRTLQLMEVDLDAQVYVLRGRDGDEPYRCTRSALDRLRSEGLATTVELGSFIARAMDTMMDTMTGKDEDLKARLPPSRAR